MTRLRRKSDARLVQRDDAEDSHVGADFCLWLKNSPTFMSVRVMFGLILIVLVAYLIAMRPFRSAFAHYMGKVSNLRAETLK
jgi:hypothetical protein